MFYSQILKNNSGFTLVEMMVAAGIVGAMTTIAVPNYLKQVAKSRESEAKIALSAIYVGEKQFALEYGYYNACLNKIGYQVANLSPQRYYAVGYESSQASQPNCGSTGKLQCNSILVGLDCTATAEYAYKATVKAGGYTAPTDADLTISGGTYLTGVGTTKFSVGAAGSIYNGSVLDKWQINQDKTLINVQSGI